MSYVYIYIFTLGTQALFHYCCVASEQEIQKHITGARIYRYSVLYMFCITSYTRPCFTSFHGTPQTKFCITSHQTCKTQ